MGRVLTDMSMVDYDYKRVTKQGSIGFDGTFGGGKWRYGAFFTHGEQEQDQSLIGLTKKAEFARAINAVSSGGSIVCAVNADADPTNNDAACRPLNLFGSGRADPAAIAYATGTWNSVTTTWLDHAGASISGEPSRCGTCRLGRRGRRISRGILPHALRCDLAGEQLQHDQRRRYQEDRQHVKEGFAEVDIPLLANLPIVQKLSFNGAVRVSDYSTSGAIWSWKLGGIWEIIEGLKIRTTRSRDIRAPSLTELFSQRSTLFTSIADSGRPNSPLTNITLFTGGNPDLRPEIADTFTVGGVIRPAFFRGFDLSVDYYNIKIDDVITTLTAQQIVNGCYSQNNQGACSQIVRDGSGVMTSINAAYINVASFKNTGIDIEASYRTKLDGIGLDGQLKVRPDRQLCRSNGRQQRCGCDRRCGLSRLPGRLPRAQMARIVDLQLWGARAWAPICGRAMSEVGGFAPAAVLANQDARIDSHIYVDLGLRAYIRTSDRNRLTVYGSVQNLFDRQPTLGAVSSPYLDIIGRHFTLASARTSDRIASGPVDVGRPQGFECPLPVKRCAGSVHRSAAESSTGCNLGIFEADGIEQTFDRGILARRAAGNDLPVAVRIVARIAQPHRAQRDPPAALRATRLPDQRGNDQILKLADEHCRSLA
ncbi:tonB dependent receptor domain-containing protein [Ditylenchus destructor]|uniref:TonB dependent receptor domain-containing protein n=1 Tax=Ditylenchus destructor TaxID=166010 RepID=A0AAD4MGB5_9BILA|nr:tonB dependent receptor domain-containing protein [Ditylenchus destructor]